jgi:hypothetical protein
VKVTRAADGQVLLNGGAAGLSGVTLCGAAGEVFTLTMLDSLGDGELCCVN